MTDSAEKIIRHKITDLLSRREHGKQELALKLQQKGFDHRLVASVLDRFVAQNLQSDARYAETVVASYFHKGKGPQFIRQYLVNKGIDELTIDQALQDVSDDRELDWFQLAYEVKVKKFGAEGPSDWQAKQKQMAFLQNRGFELSQIKAAFDA